MTAADKARARPRPHHPGTIRKHRPALPDEPQRIVLKFVFHSAEYAVQLIQNFRDKRNPVGVFHRGIPVIAHNRFSQILGKRVINAVVAGDMRQLGLGREPPHRQNPLHRIAITIKGKLVIRFARQRDDTAINRGSCLAVQFEFALQQCLALFQSRQVHIVVLHRALHLERAVVDQEYDCAVGVCPISLRPNPRAIFAKYDGLGLIGFMMGVALHRLSLV